MHVRRVVLAVRLSLAVLLVLVAVPMLAVGAALLALEGHRGVDGTFGARLVPVRADGYAVVVPDLDALLRADLPFARAGRTGVRISAEDRTVPAFIGLAPRAQVAAYLAGVAHTEITAIGVSGAAALPLTLSTVDGTQSPAAPPGAQTFWISSSADGSLHWAAGRVRGQQVSLVLMGVDANAGLALALQAAVQPSWLVPTAWAMVALGVLGVCASVLLLLGPVRRRIADPAFTGAPGFIGNPECTDDPTLASDPTRARGCSPGAGPGESPGGHGADGHVAGGNSAGVPSRAGASGPAGSGPDGAPLLPPPYRPAGPGRVWASATVRALSLGDVLDAPPVSAADPSGVRVPVAARVATAVADAAAYLAPSIAPTWVDAPEWPLPAATSQVNTDRAVPRAATPTVAARSAGPEHPAPPAAPATAQPVNEVPPTEAATRGDAPQPVDAAPPADRAEPGAASQPVGVAEPGEASQPVGVAQPGEASQPVGVAEPGEVAAGDGSGGDDESADEPLPLPERHTGPGHLGGNRFPLLPTQPVAPVD